MLSKLRRSKSSASDLIPERGLTGMPALKQRRSIQRRVQLSPGFLPARSKADCKTLAEEIALKNQAKKNMTKSTPDLLQTVPDVCPLPFNVEIIQPCVDVTKRNSSVQSVEEVQKALDDSTQAQLGYKSLDEKSGIKNSEKTEAKKEKKHKKNISKGRGLLSVKKQRQADRECLVRDSLRALTPRERESILLLEEVLKNQSDSDGESDADSEDVFARSSSSRSSSSSLVGSIIDLVGDLSDTCPTRAMLSTNRMWHDDVVESTYAEIDDVQPPKREEVQKLNVSKSKTPFYFSDDKNLPPCKASEAEPIYSVVMKPKKKKENREIEKNEIIRDEILSTGCPNSINHEDSVSPQKSRAFWKNLNSVAATSQTNGVPKFPLPTSPTHERSHRLSTELNEQTFSDVIDESLKAKPSHFVVTPSHSSKSHIVKSPSFNKNYEYTSNASSPTHAMARLSIDDDVHDVHPSTERETPRRGKPFVVNAASRSLFS